MKISGSQPLKWDEPRRRTGRIVSDLHGRLSPRLNNSWLLSLHPPLHPLSLRSFSPALSSPCLSRAPLFRRSSLLSLLSHTCFPFSVLSSSHSSLPFLLSLLLIVIFHQSSSLPCPCLFSALFPFSLALLCFFSPFPRQYSRPLQRDEGGRGGGGDQEDGGEEREVLLTIKK